MAKVFFIFIVVVILTTFLLLLITINAKSQEEPLCTAQVIEFLPGGVRAVLNCAVYPYGWNENSYGYFFWKEVGDPSAPDDGYMRAVWLDGYLIFDGFWYPPSCPTWNAWCFCDKYHSNYVLLDVVLYPDPNCNWCSPITAFGTPLYWTRGYCEYCIITFK